MRGAHHPRGDRVLVRRAELAALQVGQRLQRRIGRHQEVGLVVLEALGHDQQLVAGLLDGLDRQVRRVHQRQVVGLVGQALAQAGVVGHRLDLHRLLQQLAQVGGDGGIARADLLVRHAVGHALVDGEDQVGLGQPAEGGQDQRRARRADGGCSCRAFCARRARRGGASGLTPPCGPWPFSRPAPWRQPRWPSWRRAAPAAARTRSSTLPSFLS